MGTPKNLAQAILNAATDINEMSREAGLHHRITQADQIIMEKHLRDFLAQNFGAILLQSAGTDWQDRIISLWRKITE